MNFVREIDRSSSLLIIDSLNAAPQQGTNVLTRRDQDASLHQGRR